MNLRPSVRSERSPLLNGSSACQERRVPATASQASLVQHSHQTYRLIPFLIGARFVAVVTSTPKIQVIRQAACLWWLGKHGSGVLPSKGVLFPKALCATTRVDWVFSMAILILTVIDACGGMISSGLINYYAGRYGRKPVMVGLMMLNAISTVCFTAAMSVGGTLQNGLLIACVLLGALCGPTAFWLVFNMCVVDTTESHRRSFILNLADGLATLGTAPTYLLGGYLSRQFGVAAVFYVKLVAIFPIILYVLLCIPESSATVLQSESSEMRPPRANASALRKALNGMASILAPLQLLRPSQESTSGGGSRPLIIATSQFLNALGSNYVGNAFVTYTAVRFHIGSDELSIALSSFAVVQVVWLSLFVPSILHWCQNLYHTHPRPEGSNIEELETQIIAPTRVTGLDIYLAVLSSLLAALATIFVGLANSLDAIIAAHVMFALGTGYDPTTCSIMTSSVSSHHSDQALSALTIVKSMGALLAPLIFGSILSLTVSHFPQLVFFLCSVPIVSGAVFLLIQPVEQ